MRAGTVAALLAVLLPMVLALLAGPGTAQARAQDPASECVADGQIYVLVFEQGTELAAGCTQGQTGLARLLELTTVQTAGQGFLCQIGGRPDRCIATPVGEEPYWNYWWWRDGQWVYANIGASYRGVPGSVEAWHFSVGEPPPYLPQTASADQPPSPATADQPPSPAAADQPPSPAAADQTVAPTPISQAGLPDWAPTAITAALFAFAGAAYLTQRRKPRGG